MEKYKVLSCPSCGSTDVTEYKENELICDRCGYEFGFIAFDAKVMVEDEPDNVRRYREICAGMPELYARKNHDYGDSFHQSWLEEGAAAGRFRIGDKFNRYKKLSKGEAQLVEGETIEDTLIDMASYCIMALMEHEREREND